MLLLLCRCILWILDTDLMSTTINCESKQKLFSTLLFPEYFLLLLVIVVDIIHTSYIVFFSTYWKKCIDTHISFIYLWKLNTYVTHGASSLWSMNIVGGSLWEHAIVIIYTEIPPNIPFVFSYIPWTLVLGSEIKISFYYWTKVSSASLLLN